MTMFHSSHRMVLVNMTYACGDCYACTCHTPERAVQACAGVIGEENRGEDDE